MRPSDFKESNTVLQGPVGMDNVEPLQIHRTADGTRCISCWRPSWRERLSVLLFGRIWLDCWSGKTQPPVSLTAAKNYFQT